MGTKKNGSTPEHIDQIREIILGPQKRDYEHRFEKVESDLEQLRAEMKAGIEETRDALMAELRETAQQLERSAHEISAAQKKESAQLQSRTDEVGRQATSRLDALTRESGERLTALHGEINQALALVRKDLKMIREEFSTELDGRLRTISDAAVSRSSLGEILFELAMRLKNEPADEALQKATGTDRDRNPRN